MTISSPKKMQQANIRQLAIVFSGLVCTIFFSSCLVTKPGNYFAKITRDTTLANTASPPAELQIKNSDILSISISSLSKIEDELFSLKASALSTVAEGYPVNDEGYIHLHKLGKVKAAGLTRKQLKALLEKELVPYLKDPIVAISFSNHHVTVMGEIGIQHVLPVLNESISILDVMAQSGNVTALTKLSDVMIIREKDNNRLFKHINLEDNSIFTSPYYYLQPNDIVVLSQDEKIIKQQLRKDKYQQYSGVVLQAVSLALIVYQVFFRN